MPRELRPHGTMAAYARHHRRGETPCSACIEANRLYRLERRGGYKGRRAPLPCGTVAAAKRHYDNGEELCSECRVAWATYSRDRRAARKKREGA